MTTYLVDISDLMVEQIEDGVVRLPEDWRLLEKVSSLPPAFSDGDSDAPYTEGVYGMARWRVEDGSAPTDLEGKLVDPSFQAHYVDGEQTRVTVVSRRVRE